MDRRALIRAGGATLAAALAPIRELVAEGAHRASRQARVDWGALRRSYDLPPELLYLNHASIGTIPRPVAAARQRYLELCETNPWLYMWGGAWEAAREQTRAGAGALLGCPASDVAITHNTTEGFNLLAQGLPLGPGDEVLFSTMNHPGASVCWHSQAARRGFDVRQLEFPVADAAGLTASDIVDIYSAEIDERTRVLVFPHIDNIVGFRYPIAALAREAHRRGVEFVAVDGAQSAGMVPLDLATSGVDFYATSPHKWVQAPKGTGLLYLRPKARAHLEPMMTTWGQQRWAGTVRMFEDYGTRNLAEVLTLGDAIRFQSELGHERRRDRLWELRAAAREIVEASPTLRWRSTQDPASGTAIFAVEAIGHDARELSNRLYQERAVVFRPFALPGFNAMRLSPNVFDTVAGLERLARMVESL